MGKKEDNPTNMIGETSKRVRKKLDSRINGIDLLKRRAVIVQESKNKVNIQIFDEYIYIKMSDNKTLNQYNTHTHAYTHTLRHLNI